jgi:hypothetical protein
VLRTLVTLTAGVEEEGMPVLARAPAVEELRAGAVESERAPEVWASAMARSDREVGIGSLIPREQTTFGKRHTMGRSH